MKKLISLCSVILCAIVCLTLIGCRKPVVVEKVALDTPVVEVNEAGLAKWAEVANASGYMVKVDGTEKTQTGVNYQLTDGQKIQVKALGDDKNYKDSEYSREITYTKPAEVVKHKVTFKADGQFVGVVEFAEGAASITEPQVPAKEHFTGAWSAYQLGNADIEVNAIYTAITHKVTFKADGQVVQEVTFNEGATSITEPQVPAKEHFTGAWSAYQLGNADVEVNAVYTIIKHNVVFKADGQVVQTVEFEEGAASITEPEVPAKEHFTGAWAQYQLGNADIEVLAVYTAIKHNVTFKADGQVVEVVEFAEGATSITEPEVPAKEHFTGAWAEYTLGNEDIEVLAIYTVIKHNITFKADGQVVQTIEFEEGATSVEEPKVPAKTGFLGEWDTYQLGNADVEVNAVYTELSIEFLLDFEDKSNGDVPVDDPNWKAEKYADGWVKYTGVMQRYRDKNGSEVINFAGGYNMSNKFTYTLDAQVTTNYVSIDLGNYYNGAAKMGVKVLAILADDSVAYLLGSADAFYEMPVTTGFITFAQKLPQAITLKGFAIVNKSSLNSAYLYADNIMLGYLGEQPQLAAPAISLTASGITWEAVEHADSYEVLVGGVHYANITTTTFAPAGVPAGNYSITIIAKGAGYKASNASNAVVAKVTEKLATPVVTINEEGLASWTAITHADGYQVKVNGALKTTALTSYQLNDKDTIQVKALGDEDLYLDSDLSAEQAYAAPIKYGLPVPADGFYMTDPDVIDDGEYRYIIYTTNKTKADKDNVIALRVGTYDDEEDNWVFGDETILLEPSADGWDKFIGSASITKGTFEMGGENYNWLIAYAAADNADLKRNNIGLAVAKEIGGTWVKVSDQAIIKYDEAFGTNMTGCYAPSVINYDKVSAVRIFFTYADPYGHFQKFFDADLSDLDSIVGVEAYCVATGDLQSGDAVLLFPNADMVYDEVNHLFYAVKDYSPSAATKPQLADEFELCYIAEEELVTTDPGEGWKSYCYMDYMDLMNGFERCYSACIVSDAYGHAKLYNEIIYTVCSEGNNYLYTQQLMSFIPEF